jgi:HEPN domain-containing protein
MRPETEEWIRTADADFLSMTREINAAKDLNYDLVCFLAQQSVEKYLKGLLCENSVPFPKTLI